MTRNSTNSKHNVLQIVTNTTSALVSSSTVMPFDDTIPQITEGDEVLTATITPISSTSLLEIVFSTSGMQGGNPEVCCALFQDSTANALAAKGIDVANSTDMNLIHTMTSGTTSSTTFRIRFGPSAASVTSYLNGVAGARRFGGVSQTILKIIEYRQ